MLMWLDSSAVAVQPTAQLVLTAPVTGSVLAPPRLQLLALKLPPPGGALLQLWLTVPLGARTAACVRSVTVAVQLGGLPTDNVAGRQDTTCAAAVLLPVPTA